MQPWHIERFKFNRSKTGGEPRRPAKRVMVFERDPMDKMTRVHRFDVGRSLGVTKLEAVPKARTTECDKICCSDL